MNNSILFSSNGEIHFDINTGKVTSIIENEGEKHPPFSQIDKIDVEEYKKYYNVDFIPDLLDILDVGFWLKDGTYEAPAQDWRDMINN